MPIVHFLEAGEVVGTHGVRGEMRLHPWCDSPDSLRRVKKLYWDAEGHESVRVACRPHKTITLIKAEGIDTVQEAAAMRGRILYVDRRDLPLPAGHHFIRDLIGMQVEDATSHEVYGTLTAVSATGANDVYHLDYHGREVLIPAIPSVVRQVDVEQGVMTITPLEGQFDL